MTLHLAEIANTVVPGARAVLLVDQAGWHLSHQPIVPPSITLLPLPPKYPELNPIEDAWSKLIVQLWHIMSIGMRDWAQRD